MCQVSPGMLFWKWKPLYFPRQVAIHPQSRAPTDANSGCSRAGSKWRQQRWPTLELVLGGIVFHGTVFPLIDKEADECPIGNSRFCWTYHSRSATVSRVASNVSTVHARSHGLPIFKRNSASHQTYHTENQKYSLNFMLAECTIWGWSRSPGWPRMWALSTSATMDCSASKETQQVVKHVKQRIKGYFPSFRFVERTTVPCIGVLSAEFCLVMIWLESVFPLWVVCRTCQDLWNVLYHWFLNRGIWFLWSPNYSLWSPATIGSDCYVVCWGVCGSAVYFVWKRHCG